MPEFTTKFTTAALKELDQFTRDYLTALEWTDCNADHDGDEGPSFEDATALSPELIAEAAQDCRDFQRANVVDLKAYQDATGHIGGVDFWLTRNGHGAGFWDRGLGKLGDRLSAAAKAYGGRDVYVGDDLLIYTS